MTEYRKMALLYGPEGAQRGAPIEFVNRIRRDMTWIEFDDNKDAVTDGTGIWKVTNIGSPTAPGIAVGFNGDFLMPGSIGFFDPGSAAAGSGAQFSSYSAILPTAGKNFEFGFYALYCVGTVPNLHSFVGLSSVDAAPVGPTGAFVASSISAGFLLSTARELRLRSGTVFGAQNVLIKSGVLDGEFLELELHGTLSVTAAGIMTGRLEAYFNGRPVGSPFNLTTVDVSLIPVSLAVNVVRLAGASSVLKADCIGTWSSRR